MLNAKEARELVAATHQKESKEFFRLVEEQIRAEAVRGLNTSVTVELPTPAYKPSNADYFELTPFGDTLVVELENHGYTVDESEITNQYGDSSAALMISW